MEHHLNQADSLVTNLNLIRRIRDQNLSDHDKIVYAYHLLQDSDSERASKLLTSVSKTYLKSGLHIDISRALLCHLINQRSPDALIGKESEFYLVIYGITLHVAQNSVEAGWATPFRELKERLFKDMNLYGS